MALGCKDLQPLWLEIGESVSSNSILAVEFWATSTATASGTIFFILSRAGSVQILSPGKPGTPACKSGQLENDLGLEVRSARHAARLVMFEVMKFFFVGSK